MTSLELLAPAKNLETAKAAINCGADAVYIGAEEFGARQAAGNSVEDIELLCEYAHQFGVRVYVTLNTIIYEDELGRVKNLVNRLYDAGVDALIVQDMALLELDLPPIELHASTQCDIRTPEKARFLEKAGFSQLVLPRELTLDEIREFRKVTTVPLEAFVHGALCVCYSGVCRASFFNGGRSANRGECAQICRLPYNLVDGTGKTIIANRHLLSLKDMNRRRHLEEMIECGVTSFKIEGRLKSTDYVRNVVAEYSRALDEIVRAHPDNYRRLSFGISEPGFLPDLSEAFNRGFTDYFLIPHTQSSQNVSSPLTPKFTGPEVARVLDATSNYVTVESATKFANGDGLVFLDSEQRYNGFRVNSVKGNTLYPARPLSVVPSKGAILKRNYNKAFDDTLKSARSHRSLRLNASFKISREKVSLTLIDEAGRTAQKEIRHQAEPSRSPQTETRRRIMERLGDTVFTLESYKEELVDGVDFFIPASQLAALRREAIARLAANRPSTPMQVSQNLEISNDVNNSDKPLRYIKSEADVEENVANSLSKRFYESHGAKVTQFAVETQKPQSATDQPLMTTRFCLRRELGACLRNPDKHRGTKIVEPVTLVPAMSENVAPMRVEFDCVNCRMKLYAADIHRT